MSVTSTWCSCAVVSQAPLRSGDDQLAHSALTTARDDHQGGQPEKSVEEHKALERWAMSAITQLQSHAISAKMWEYSFGSLASFKFYQTEQKALKKKLKKNKPKTSWWFIGSSGLEAPWGHGFVWTTVFLRRKRGTDSNSGNVLLPFGLQVSYWTSRGSVTK